MNQITNAVEGLQEKESLLWRFTFKEKKKGKSSIMQVMGDSKLGSVNLVETEMQYFFFFLNCNICIAWMTKSTKAEKRS